MKFHILKCLKPEFTGSLLLILLTTGCNVFKTWDPPFWPTPQSTVKAMLELAQVTSEDVVFDLGSGDGRIVITAAKTYGARGVGIEIDPKLVKMSR